MRSLIALSLLCAPAVAGTFRTENMPLQMSVRDSLGQSQLVNFGAPFTVHTDYHTASWEIDFTGLRVDVSGGPSEPFEAYIDLDGTITSDAVDLSFPNSSGEIILANTGVTFDTDWTFTERIVTATNIHSGARSEYVTGYPWVMTTREINVSDHPDSISFLGRTNTHAGHDLGEAEGVSVVFWLNRYGANPPTDLFPVNPGDFNDDGAVGAADFVVSRNGRGLAPLLAPMDVWRENFHPSGSAAAVIPEPSSGVLAVVALLFLHAMHRRVI